MAIVLDYIKDAELFNKTAEHWAGKIVGTKSTQIRNFYEYVLELNQRAENEVWNEVLPFVKMLNSKVNYAQERKVASRDFVEMINECVNQITTKTQLNVFKLFFEAVIGFAKKGERR